MDKIPNNKDLSNMTDNEIEELLRRVKYENDKRKSLDVLKSDIYLWRDISKAMKFKINDSNNVTELREKELEDLEWYIASALEKEIFIFCDYVLSNFTVKVNKYDEKFNHCDIKTFRNREIPRHISENYKALIDEMIFLISKYFNEEKQHDIFIKLKNDVNEARKKHRDNKFPDPRWKVST